jgi:hypothetical protein
MDKMNEDRKQLTFRDHLDALRAVSYATGRIASLLEIRERLYKPYQEVEKQYRGCFDQVGEIVEELGVKIYGQEQWEQMQLEDMRQIMMNEAAPPKSLKPDRQNRKVSR